MIDVVTNGKIRSSSAVMAVESLLKKTKTKSLWEVVDFLIKVFENRYPQYSKLRSQAMIERRKSLLNKHGSNKEKDLRHLISLPVALNDLMTYFLKDYNNKQFWREFARRYPQYSVPERSNI